MRVSEEERSVHNETVTLYHQASCFHVPGLGLELHNETVALCVSGLLFPKV